MPSTTIWNATAGAALTGVERFANDKGPNPGDSQYITADQIRTFTRQPPITRRIPLDYDSNDNDYRVKNIGSSGTKRVTFDIPNDFSTLIGLRLFLYVTSGAVGSGKDIDLTSDYGALGENIQIHSESDLATVYTFTAADVHTAYTISQVFTQISAGDLCGLTIDHNGIGGTGMYTFVEIEYNPIA